MDRVLARAKEDPEVVAVILFGSRARGDASAASDVDLCLVLRPGRYSAEYLLNKRLGYLAEGAADIHIFAQLPIYIRRRIKIKRACERLLQISIEAILDICHLLVTGLRLGIPAEEADALEKLGAAQVLSPGLLSTLKEMRGFRNVLVHEYTRIDDTLVYRMAKTRLDDFQTFKREVIKYLKTQL